MAYCTLPELTRHLKMDDIPKGNDHLPTIHLKVRTVSFREGNVGFVENEPNASEVLDFLGKRAGLI